MKTLKKIVARPFLFLIYFFSGFVPRDLRLWVFGSYGKRFTDNSKYLFLHCLSHTGKHVRCVWISRSTATVKTLKDMGLPAYSIYSLQGIWYTLRAGIFIFNAYISDINFWTSRGAVKINLWHGLPLKKIERDIDDPNNYYYKIHHGSFCQSWFPKLLYPWLSKPYDMVISTSGYISRAFIKAFGLTLEKIPVTGLPRNDAFFENSNNAFLKNNAYYNQVSAISQEGKRVIVYMPTFRDSADRKRELPFNWGELDQFLQVRGACLFLKLHTNDSAAFPTGRYNNIFIIPSGEDLYPTLELVDVLITDYSSIYFDYLLLDRPVVFYSYDFDEYISKHRSLCVDYHEVTAGPKAFNFEELLLALDEVLLDDRYKQERKRIRERYHEFVDGNSSQRVLSEIYNRFLGRGI